MNAGASGVQAMLALTEDRRRSHLVGGAQPGPWAQTSPSTQGAWGSSLLCLSWILVAGSFLLVEILPS